MFDLPSHVSWNANRVPFYSFWVFASDDEALNHPISLSLSFSVTGACLHFIWERGGDSGKSSHFGKRTSEIMNNNLILDLPSCIIVQELKTRGSAGTPLRNEMSTDIIREASTLLFLVALVICYLVSFREVQVRLLGKVAIQDIRMISGDLI